LHNAGNYGHSELLHWETIKLSKQLGSKYYDLCNLNKNELPEIYQFKTGISKDIFQYPYFYKSSFAFKVVNRIEKLFK
jgi:lipid II:glycine glycyltransferase (peptidoglycan interpeptide bridge formation enzyme)